MRNKTWTRGGFSRDGINKKIVPSASSPSNFVRSGGVDIIIIVVVVVIVRDLKRTGSYTRGSQSRRICYRLCFGILPNRAGGLYRGETLDEFADVRHRSYGHKIYIYIYILLSENTYHKQDPRLCWSACYLKSGRVNNA